MTENKVACPKCQAPLKSNKKIPPGIQIKCPRCGESFGVPGNGFSAWQPASSSRAPAVGILVPDSRGASRPGNAAVAAAAPGGHSKARVFFFLVLGSVVLVAGGGLLIFLCFSGAPQKTGSRQNLSSGLNIPEPEFKPLPPRPLIPLTKEEQSQVDQALSRGVAYLKKTQAPEGTWAGPRPVEFAALAGMSLLECGVPGDDPVVKKAAAYVRKQVPTITNTYGVSLYILFLNKLNEPQDKHRIGQLALRLVMGQTPHGGWSYECPNLSPQDQEQLGAFLKELGKQNIREFQKHYPTRVASLPVALRTMAVLQDPEGKPPDYFRQGGDNSNTQFAILALWAAKGQKLPVDRTLELVVRRFRACQNADGSWNYSGYANASHLPTMTCAGLLGLAVSYGLDSAPAQRNPPDQDPAIQKAIQHLGKSIGTRNLNSRVKPPMVEMYFLWSVERVGVLFQFKTIAEKEWYHWGMNVLLAHQNADGSWQGGAGHGSCAVLDTCFALLFLQRANLAQDLTDKIQEMFAPAISMIRSLPPSRRQ